MAKSPPFLESLLFESEYFFVRSETFSESESDREKEMSEGERLVNRLGHEMREERREKQIRKGGEGGTPHE